MRLTAVAFGVATLSLASACSLPSTPPAPQRVAQPPAFEPSSVAVQPVQTNGSPASRRVVLPPSVLNRMVITTQTPPPADPGAPTPAPTPAPAPTPTTAAPMP